MTTAAAQPSDPGEMTALDMNSSLGFGTSTRPRDVMLKMPTSCVEPNLAFPDTNNRLIFILML